ncbi:MAG TPA: hypothetical protein VFQ61_19610 [Polyangiaceae bacterium]|nr:hypothetical protein [Polyangiaceae bacterium]
MPSAYGMVTLAVAQKMLANRVKGNLAFKPDHGEHGQCSWFVSSGNPYTGITPGKDIRVNIEVEHANIVRDDSIVNDTLASFKDHERALRESNRRAFDLLLWNTIGSHLRKTRPSRCSNVLVPQGEVSRQGGGYFLVVPPFAAGTVKVTNWGEIETIVLARSPNFLRNCLAAEETKNTNLSARVTVELGPCESNAAITLLRQRLQAAYQGATATLGAAAPRVVAIPSGWNGATKNVTRFAATDQLVYRNFREARNAFKELMRLAAALNSGGAQASYVKVFGGADWNVKQSSLYTAPNQPRQRFAP